MGKDNQSTGLNRWFREKWTNQKDKTGDQSKSGVYRLTQRITKETPTTFNELSKKDIDRARREKASKGRVEKFKQNK